MSEKVLLAMDDRNLTLSKKGKVMLSNRGI